MKILQFSTLASLAGLVAFPSLAPAQEAVTDPVGVKTYTIFGSGKVSIIPVDLHSPRVYSSGSGVLDSHSLQDLNSGVNFTQILDPSKFYSVEFSGNNSHLHSPITSWTSNQLNLETNLSQHITGSPLVYHIREIPTLVEILGVGGEILQGGSATTADRILVRNRSGSGMRSFYYSTGGFAGVGWREIGSGSQNRANFPIYFTDSLYILKRSTGNSEIVISGQVRTTPALVSLPTGLIAHAAPVAAGTTLGNSGLFNSSNPSASLRSGSATTADVIYTDSTGDGNLEAFFYSSGGFAGNGWRRVGGGSFNAENVGLENGFAVLNRNSPLSLIINSPITNN